ncbi:hypothetical protein [Paenibacillus sp. OK076]|uniref:hypothetical protein n=1 Tax=Paenibacillus sp. OK076 TaxID=1884379 RepID=UPI000B878D27|nr:hypothetical protein [Paenibacillus sp. OK076]
MQSMYSLPPIHISKRDGRASLFNLLTRFRMKVKIPGTRSLERVHENLGALQVSFTKDEWAEIERISPKGFAAGGRYPGLA